MSISLLSKVCSAPRLYKAQRQTRKVAARSHSVNSVLLTTAAAAVLLVHSDVASAQQEAYAASTQYEREMLELIKARGITALEVKPAESNFIDTAAEAPVVKVDANMNPEQRSKAIRAEATKIAAADARASKSMVGGGSSANSQALVLGAAVVAAALGGAYYRQTITPTGSQPVATAGSAADVPAVFPQELGEREQSPAPSV